jgi:hypothetical protein
VSADNLIPPSTYGEVRIVHRPDGTATVNGAPIAVQPGQDPRDAAYQAAVELAVSLGATGPVVATSVEPDGAAYPVTLYPTPAALAAADASAASVGAASAFNRVRRAWYRPTLSVSWLAAAAFACVLLSVLATVLLREGGPSVVRLSVDTESDPAHAPGTRSAGRAIATAPGAMTSASVRALAKKAAAAGARPSASPSPALSHASTAAVPGIGIQPTTGLPPVTQPSTTAPSPTPSSSPKPTPTPTPTSTKPAAVTNLALSLVGGDSSDQSIAFVATASTDGTGPITLTYTYAGTKGPAPVTQTVRLSGHTNYMLADLIPAQPYCGGPVTMTVSTSPAAKTGSVTETAQPGC